MSSPPANLHFCRCAPTATQIFRQHLFLAARDRRLGAYVGLAAETLYVSSQRWKQGSTRGTIDPGVVVRRSSLKLRHSRCRRDWPIHHRANLARDGWPDPHLRTGDVTLVFTTDETCSNV